MKALKSIKTVLPPKPPPEPPRLTPKAKKDKLEHNMQNREITVVSMKIGRIL